MSEAEIAPTRTWLPEDTLQQYDLSWQMGYTAAHLLCRRLVEEGIKPKDLQSHISIGGWFDDLTAGSDYGAYDFSGFLSGTDAAWNQIEEGIQL